MPRRGTITATQGEGGYARQATQLPTGETVFDATVMRDATGRRAMEAAMPEVRAMLDLAHLLTGADLA